MPGRIKPATAFVCAGRSVSGICALIVSSELANRIVEPFVVRADDRQRKQHVPCVWCGED